MTYFEVQTCQSQILFESLNLSSSEHDMFASSEQVKFSTFLIFVKPELSFEYVFMLKDEVLALYLKFHI